MKSLLVILLIIHFGVFIVQDFSSRTISLLAIISFGVVSVGWFYMFLSIYEVIFNFLFISLILLSAATIVRLVKKISATKMIGLGDVLFFYVIIFLFPFTSFILVFNISLIGSLIGFVCFHQKKSVKQENQLIPLAGYFSIIFGLALIFDSYVFPINNLIY